MFADLSRHISQEAGWWARRLQAEIILLHVVQPLNYPAGIFEAGDEITAQDLTSRAVCRAQHDLNQTVPPEPAGIAVTRLLLRGDPAFEIANTAQGRNVDLIMMATRGYGAFHCFLLGSVTAKVLHESDCPVWPVAHSGAKRLTDAAARSLVDGILNCVCRHVEDICIRVEW